MSTTIQRLWEYLLYLFLKPGTLKLMEQIGWTTGLRIPNLVNASSESHLFSNFLLQIFFEYNARRMANFFASDERWTNGQLLTWECLCKVAWVWGFQDRSLDIIKSEDNKEIRIKKEWRKPK